MCSFKQKTAYEMRISDGSSDVCSSDLLARGIGQRLDAAVVAVAGTVEGDLLDARRPGLLGDGATDLGGGLDVLVALQAVADVGLRGAGRGEHLRAVGAEQLRVDVLAGAQHRQARHAEFADMRAGRLGAAQACGSLVHLLAPGES